MKNYLKAFLCVVLLLCSAGHYAQDQPWEGSWLLDFRSADLGDVQLYMDIYQDKEGFEAHTREKAAGELFGGWNAFLAKAFTPHFSKGALLWVKNGSIKQRGDTTLLNGIFTSAMGNYYFNGIYFRDALTVQLLNGKKELRGTMTGVKSDRQPLRNYRLILDSAFAVTANGIYDPEMVNNKEFLKFRETISEKAEAYRDDAELLFTFFFHSRKLPFSHYALVRETQRENTGASATVSGTRHASLEDVGAGEKSTAYLDINSFGGSAEEIDSLFGIILKKNYDNLIIDLRGNSGGNVESGITLVSYLVSEPGYGGIFLTQKWFSTHSAPPPVSEYNHFPEFSQASYDLIIKGIHEEEGLALKVYPADETYKGTIFILTDGRTASTCEPIVKELQSRGRALLVGENTAGAMLNAEYFYLPEGFKLYLPTADYYASDGTRLDQNGVAPDVKVRSGEALEKALELVAADR